MSLTKGSGPFGERPAGEFNFDPRAPEHVLYLERCPRRVRVLLDGTTLADSDDVRVLHPPGRAAADPQGSVMPLAGSVGPMRVRGRMVTAVEVVLPCLDEADALPGVLRALPAGCTALVVDNRSTDDTPEVTRGLRARMVHEPRRGYGAAVHTRLEHARTELVVVLDTDGSLDPGALPELRDVDTVADAALVAAAAPGGRFTDAVREIA